MRASGRAWSLLLTGGLAALASWIPPGAPALAAAPVGGEIGLLVGETGSDADITNDQDSNDPAFGLRVGAVFSPRVGWFFDALHASPSTRTGLGDARIWSERVGLELTVFPERRLRWFLTGGAGWMAVDYQDSSSQDFERLFVSGGVGAKFEVARLRTVRLELRADTTVDDEGLAGADVFQGHLLAGFVWGPGTRSASPAAVRRPKPARPRQTPRETPRIEPLAAPAPQAPAVEPEARPPAPQAVRDDEDGDGVKNRHDRCRGTPRGATVDADGCPGDSDRDGVLNGLDRCPTTPQGLPVDASGCAADADGDGVPDTSDSCTGTPRGAVVDEWGCPRDSDGDGSPNGLDQCAGTPAGAVVDPRGCPRDADGDGVYDGIDRCPETPGGTFVDERGCPR
jgi:hypothetical protein